jgi:hypothetical protein
MAVSRRLLLLGFAVVGFQLLPGCYCYRPFFPRLQWCGAGGCNTPLLSRLAAPAGGPVGGPVVSGPVYDAPVYDAPVYSGHGYAGPSYGVPVSGGVYDAGPHCSNCGPTGAGVGLPIATTPPFGSGIPIGIPVQSTPITTTPGVPMAMPSTPPSAMRNGIPYDSSLAPTVKPPTGGGKLDSLTDSRKILTAGK